MSESSVTSHPVHLQNLAALCRAVAKALLEAGVGQDKLEETFGRTVSGACVQCGIRLKGAELFPLAILSDEESEPSPPVARVREGYCGRRGCNSYYYRVELAPHPGVDWARVWTALESPATPEPAEGPIPVPAYGRLLHRVAWREWAWKAVAATALLALLLLIRQWHAGGTIPVVRQPEKFVVDPSPGDL